MLWSVGLRVIGNPIEVELRDVARVITGISRRGRSARALHEWQTEAKGIDRVGRMHMHVPEQNLFGIVDAQLSLGATLRCSPGIHLWLRCPGLTDFAWVEGVSLPIPLGIWDIAGTGEVGCVFFSRPYIPARQHCQHGREDSSRRYSNAS